MTIGDHNTKRMLLVGVLLLAGCATGPQTSAQRQASRPAMTVLGEWKEYWDTSGQTDVTYHDQYRVTHGMDGNVKVQILSRNQKIYDERLNDTVLTFTQSTDVYIVKYSLTLQQDGRWLVGTATTPKEIVNIKWEKTQ